MNLARRFNAGMYVNDFSRRISTIEKTPLISGVATRREHIYALFPALKGRAKFMPTLRVEVLGSLVVTP
jgi:hypothetical protein